MPSLNVIESLEENATPITELRIGLSEDGSDELLAELYVGQDEVELGGSLFVVGLVSASLRAELEGVSIVLGSKVGAINPLKTDRNLEKQTELRNKKAAVLTALLNPEGVVPVLGAEVSGSKETAAVDTRKSNVRHIGIRALAGPNWKLENPRGELEPMVATILNGERLCKLRVQGGANRYRVHVCIEALPVEVEVRQKIGRPKTSSTNRDRVLGILATRALSSENRYSPNAPVPIVFSQAELQFSVEDAD